MRFAKVPALFLAALLSLPGQVTAQQECLAGSSVAPGEVAGREMAVRSLGHWVGQRMGIRSMGLPRICVVTRHRLADLLASSGGSSALKPVALYESATATIYLSAAFVPDNPLSQSVIVHELVHHAQAVAGLRYACPQAAEKVAYDIQQEWLGQYGLDLKQAFGIDGLTRFILTNCGI